MSGKAELGGRFIGLALNVGLLAVLSLVSIPALIANAGESGWGDIALGQSIGMFLSIPLAYGWGFHGPATVARNRDDPTALSREVLESIKLRGALLPGVLVLGVAAAFILSPSDPVLAMAGVLSVVLVGLRMSWLFVGLGSPRLLFLLETLPRAIGLAASVLLLWLVPNSSIAALCIQALSICLSVAITVVWERARLRPKNKPQMRSFSTLLRAHAHGVSGQSVSALWGSLPTMTIAVLAPSALPAFALGMRVYAQANTATSPLVDTLQGWVPRKTLAETAVRSRQGLGIASIASLALACAFLIVGGPLLDLLGAGQVATTSLDVTFIAAAIALSLMAQTVTRVVLAALDQNKQYAMNTYVSVALGATVLFTTIDTLGPTAGYLSILAALSAQVILGLTRSTILRRGRSQ